MPNTYQHDALIIGGGAAGLSLALRIADKCSVAIITKGPSKDGSTYFAQGGMSAVLSEEDSFESHIKDTLNVGGSLSDEDTVRYVIERGPENIRWMQELGVPFSSEIFKSGDRKLHLTREGGHTHRRVVHAADATGKAMSDTLENHARHHSNITFYEHHNAVDLITSNKQNNSDAINTCIGAYVLNKKTNRVETFQARFVVLATGGASKVYLYTSNPDGSTGDGIAMAWRAGCSVSNMEFNQFHPTCLYHPKAKSFLISEAIRGEGGKLLLPNGKRFMHKFDERGELAPRDIVARAIDHEMKRLGASCVYLDISHRSPAFIASHFPTIYERCLKLGIDITKDPIPVVPAAHYTCGGVNTDLNGRTDINNLYAIGETAHTGLHGSNRMASNSLLECLVFSQAAAKHITENINEPYQYQKISHWDESRVTDSDEDVVISHNWDELRRFMWDYVGIVRTNKRLERAMHRASLLQQEIAEYYSNFRISSDLIELRNLTLVAELIIRSAMLRKESRGLHFSLDYPVADDTSAAKNTVLKPQQKPNKDDKNVISFKL
ncbi:L-aspartate oxidase [hydrothermal vent metagenome]|uniref:L-aspartate oxidase n=1 Tax=hydrothermal vent metagenome TaxID=652676 RepID=A0A3B0WDZ0_9ZZZZ